MGFNSEFKGLKHRYMPQCKNCRKGNVGPDHVIET